LISDRHFSIQHSQCPICSRSDRNFPWANVGLRWNNRYAIDSIRPLPDRLTNSHGTIETEAEQRGLQMRWQSLPWESPFPGMDPFLEDAFFWPQVHNRLIVALSNELGAKLRPKYYAAIETRIYLDNEDTTIEIKERYLEIRKVGTHEVIVAIEILPLPHQSHYHILVSDSRDRPEADLYSFNLQDPIPVFNLPLQPEDVPIAIDLAHLLQEVYEQGCYDLQINYQSVLPDLSPADVDWVKQVVDRSVG
jgi:hypothetical protein